MKIQSIEKTTIIDKYLIILIQKKSNMDKKHMKRRSTSQITREMHIETTPIRMVTIQKKERKKITSIGEKVKLEPLCIVGGIVK